MQLECSPGKWRGKTTFAFGKLLGEMIRSLKKPYDQTSGLSCLFGALARIAPNHDIRVFHQLEVFAAGAPSSTLSSTVVSFSLIPSLVPRRNFEGSPGFAPRRAKTVFGDRGVRVAGIDIKALARDKVRILRRQKNRRADEIFRFAQSA